MNMPSVDLQSDETLEQSLDRHAIARARCQAGLVETGELEVAAPSWAFIKMPWVGSSVAYDRDDAKVNPFAVEID